MTETPTATPSTDVVAVPDMARGAIAGVSLDARIRYARALSDADLLPAAYRRRPGNVLLATETGTMLGIHPVAAINGVNVIEGKPTISPALMTALVRRAGHKVRVKVTGTVAAGDVEATCTVIRADDPDEPFVATWNLERAQRAELCSLSVDQQGRTRVTARSSKGQALPWEKYTEAMLKARAIGEACREAAEEALCGVHYTPEEMGAVVDSEGALIGEVVDEQPAQQQPPAAAATQQPEQPSADDVRDVMLSATSRAGLMRALAVLGFADADGKLNGVALRAVEVADRNGQPCSAWDLLGTVGRDLPAEDPEPQPEQSPTAAAAGEDADPWAGDPNLPPRPTAEQQGGEDVVDAEIVEHVAGCQTGGCTEPETHTDHWRWVAERRAAAGDVAEVEREPEAGAERRVEPPEGAGRAALQQARQQLAQRRAQAGEAMPEA